MSNLREEFAKMPRKLKLYYANFVITWMTVFSFVANVAVHGWSIPYIVIMLLLIINLILLHELIEREKASQ